MALALGGAGDQTEIAGLEGVMDPGTDSPAHESPRNLTFHHCDVYSSKFFVSQSHLQLNWLL